MLVGLLFLLVNETKMIILFDYTNIQGNRSRGSKSVYYYFFRYLLCFYIDDGSQNFTSCAFKTLILLEELSPVFRFSDVINIDTKVLFLLYSLIKLFEMFVNLFHFISYYSFFYRLDYQNRNGFLLA